MRTSVIGPKLVEALGSPDRLGLSVSEHRRVVCITTVPPDPLLPASRRHRASP